MLRSLGLLMNLSAFIYIQRWAPGSTGTGDPKKTGVTAGKFPVEPDNCPDFPDLRFWLNLRSRYPAAENVPKTKLLQSQNCVPNWPLIGQISKTFLFLVWKAFCSLTIVGQYAIMGCSYRIPTPLGQGVFVAILNILTNVYYFKQKRNGIILRRLSALSLMLCTGWDAYSTRNGYQKSARKY